MKKFIIIGLVVIIVCAVFIGYAVIRVTASDLTNADYKGLIYISNNSTATTYVSCNVSGVDTEALVAAGYIDSACTRVAILDSGDAPFMPGYGTNPWCVFVPSIGANATLSYSFYTGNATLASTKYMMLTSGTVTDHASLEWSTNASITATDAGLYNSTEDIAHKPNAYRFSYDTGSLWLAIAQTTTYATGTASSATWPTPANASDGDTGTSSVLNVNGWSDYLYLTIPQQYVSGLRWWYTTGGAVNSLQIEAQTNDGWVGLYSGVPGVAGGWVTAATDLELTSYLRLRVNTGVLTAVGIFEFQIATAISTTVAVPYGDYDVSGSINATTLAIDVDSGAYSSSNATAGAGVPGNGYDIILLSSVPYCESVKHYVGGNLVGYWYWEYAATFTDHGDDATSNTMTPTFRTTSSDTDVSAYLATFGPVDTADAPSTTVQDAPDFLSDNVTATGDFTATGIPSTGGPPGAALVEDVATGTSTPIPWLWGIVGFFTIAFIGIVMSYVRRGGELSGGYVLLCMGLIAGFFGLAIAFGKFDWWMMWFFLIIGSGIATMSRHIELGGATSQHSLIGFLAMAWIGLTLINRILEGAFITGAETAWINTMSFTQNFNFLNLFFVPIMNFQFFTEGIPSLLRWDYSFFGGQAQIIQYMLYSITAVVSFILFGILLGLIYSAFSRSRV